MDYKVYSSLDPGLVLLLPLNKMDGNTFMSSDAWGHSCINNGTVWTMNGRYFNGIESLSVADSPSLSGLGPLTIECWFWQNGKAADKRADGSSGKREWEFVLDSSGRLRFVLGSDAEPSTNHLLAVGTKDLSDANWHHVVVTWNGINEPGNITLYADGEKEILSEDVKTGIGAVPWHSMNDIELGRYSLNYYCFTGRTGIVRIYTRSLTLHEIQHNYLSTS